jgi:hypothetical protein
LFSDHPQIVILSGGAHSFIVSTVVEGSAFALPLHMHEIWFQLAASNDRPKYSWQEPKDSENPVNTKNLKTSLPTTKQPIQKWVLRSTKINPAKAVFSFTQPDIRRREQIPDKPGDQSGLSHLYPGS